MTQERTRPDEESESMLGLEKLPERAARMTLVRAKNEPAFVLIARAWKETSVVAELITPHYGRVCVSVRGAKRAGGKFRGLINPFCALVVDFSGVGEVKNLTNARWAGTLMPEGSERLFSAYYANEIVLRLTARDDPQPRLFEIYRGLLSQLSDSTLPQSLSAQMRRFEFDALQALGWGQDTEGFDASNERWSVKDGVLVPDPTGAFSADVVYAVLSGTFQNEALTRASRSVLRAILEHHLGQRPLTTRAMLKRWGSL